MCRIGLQCMRSVQGDTSASTANMPATTSTVMAPILDRQYHKLQAPPFNCVPSSGIPLGLAERSVATPFCAEAWGMALAGHPNPERVKALLDGMRQGYRIEIQETPRCWASYSSSPFAWELSEVIHQYVQDQLKKGYMVGPFPLMSVPISQQAAWQSSPKRQLASGR